MFLETPAHQFELEDSRLFFLPPFCRHTFFAQSRNQFLVLDVPDSMFLSEEVDLIQAGLSPALDERWRALRFLLLAEVQHRPVAAVDRSVFGLAA